MGSALHAFGDGEIKRGDMVTPQQLQLLIGAGLDPITGEKLGRAFPTFPALKQRMADRAAELPSDLSDEQRKDAIAQIKAEESGKQSSGVAGFDYTFSVPKSVSALWGVADAGTQALIVEAHHQAVAEVLDFMEREVVSTRRGVAAGDGAVMQADIIGVAATAYDHWDSRLGDPQLHTHVVISNKVKTTEDGRWRSLDGRPMFEANVPISEHYNAVLADRMTRLFGIEWEQRERGAERQPGLGACARPRAAHPRVLQPVQPHRQGEGPAHRGVHRAHWASPTPGEDHPASSQGDSRNTPREGDPLPVRPDDRVARTGAEDPGEGRSRLGDARSPLARSPVLLSGPTMCPWTRSPRLAFPWSARSRRSARRGGTGTSGRRHPGRRWAGASPAPRTARPSSR